MNSTTTFLGAAASSAGDDFHELWALHKVLGLLNHGSNLVGVKVEGVPDDERHAQLGEKAQAVDITEISRDETGQDVYVYEQLKHSSANPDQEWSWARLTAGKSPKSKKTSVLGKLAAVYTSVAGRMTFRIVTNQPAMVDLAGEIERVITNLNDGGPESPVVKQVKKATGLDAETLVRFLRAWDTTTFGTAPRQAIELEIIRKLSDLTDADAKADLDFLQQRISALILPEGQAQPLVKKETLMMWLGVGSRELLFPAASSAELPDFVLQREDAADIAQKIEMATAPYVVLHAPAGCGKTTFLATLGACLPAGSISIVYDCYGGELFFASDRRRHLPEHVFIQVANELAGAVGSPFVLRKETSGHIATAFLKRVRAAAEILKGRCPTALIVLSFDAADNSRTAAKHWNEPCFLDELFSLSSFPDNVRVVVSCRTGRRDLLKAPKSALEIPLSPFTETETLQLVKHYHPTWSDSAGVTLHSLSTGTPRRLHGAILNTHTPEEAVARLSPKTDGLDGLFDQLVLNAGKRLGSDTAVWKLMCAVANIPRPVATWVLAATAGLTEGDVDDIARETGGIIFRQGGWTLQNEDFEGYVDERTKELVDECLSTAITVVEPKIDTIPYAAKSIAELYLASERFVELYDLVLNGQVPVYIGNEMERRSIAMRRMTLAIKCSHRNQDLQTTIRLLLASAASRKAEEQIQNLLVSNIHLAVKFDPDALYRLVMSSKQYLNRRARVRIHFAARDVISDEVSTRDHLRWWHASLDDRHQQDEKQRFKINSYDLAAEFKVNWHLSGLDEAIRQLTRWSPKDLLLPVVSHLALDVARASPGLVLEVLQKKRWRREIVLSLLYSLYLAKAEPAEKLEFLFAFLAKRTRWLTCSPYGLETKKSSADLGALLFVCERGVGDTKLHLHIEKLVRAAFFPTDTSHVEEVRKRISPNGLLARAIALIDHMRGQDTPVEDLVPKQKPRPHAPLSKGDGKRNLSEIEKKENAEVDRLNEEITRLIRNLKFDVGLAKACLETDVSSKRIYDQSFEKFRSVRTAYWNGDEHERDSRLFAAIRNCALHGAINGTLDRESLAELLGIVSGRQVYYREEINLLKAIRTVPGANWLIAAPVSRLIAEVKSAALAATDRSKVLMSLAKLAADVDDDLSQTAYEAGYQIVETVDIDAMSQLYLLSAITEQGIDASPDVCRNYAERIADAVGSVSETLQYGGDFPWKQAIKSIGALDFGTALLAISRWHDAGTISIEQSLQFLMDCDAAKALSASHQMALQTLYSKRGEIGPAPDTATGDFLAIWNSIYLRQAALTGEVEILVNAADHIIEQRQSLENWVQPLLDAVSGAADIVEQEQAAPVGAECTTKAEFEAELAKIGAEKYVSANDVVELAYRIHREVFWVPFLDSVAQMSKGDALLAQVFIPLSAKWLQYPPVRKWSKTTFVDYLTHHLPRLFEWHYHDTEPLEAALDVVDLTDAEKADLMLFSIEKNAEEMTASRLYGCMTVLCKLVSKDLRGPVLDQFIRHYEQAIDIEPPIRVKNACAPIDINEIVAGFIFAQLGDISKFLRWRAAHAVRRLGIMGDGKTLGCLIARLSSGNPEPFNVPTMPFYTLAAQQFLSVAVQRVARDMPAMIAPYSNQLVQDASSQSPILTKQFLKDTIAHLAVVGAVTLSVPEQAILSNINISPLKMRNRQNLWRGRGEADRDINEGRQYRFDSTDTLPYWMTPVVAYFDIEFAKFLDVVESYIVTKWGFTSTATEWLKEPRGARFANIDWQLSSHRHGSRPPMERLSRYLDWYGLECAVGDLIKTTPLIKKKDRWDDDLYDWIQNQGLTDSRFWLSDLRDPPPPNAAFWAGDENDDHFSAEWVNKVRETAFADALHLKEEGEDLIAVAGSYVRDEGEASEQVDIRSAFVTPAFDFALARALQTAEDWMDYILPPAGDSREIRENGFQFLGWLHDNDRDPYFDDDDVFRGRAKGIPFQPSETMVKFEELQFDLPSRGWKIEGETEVPIGFRVWGTGEDRGASGFRGWANKAFLTKLARKTGMSLLIEIHIKRRIRQKPDDLRKYRRRLFLIRSDGSIMKTPTGRTGLGCALVQAAGLSKAVDTWGRCILHQMEIEVRQATVASEKKLEKLIRQFCSDDYRSGKWKAGKCQELIDNYRKILGKKE